MLIGFEVKIELPIIGIISLLKREEKVSDAVRGEHRLAKDTHDLEHRSANLEVMFNDGNETVGDDGDMNRMRTAFSDSPQNLLTRRCCLIHLKNSSTCHLYL